MTKEQEATKQRLIELTDELTAAVFGAAPPARPIASMCRETEEVRLSEVGKTLGYPRPYAWLQEWRAFTPSAGPSEAEQERRHLADAGWVSSTKEDERRRVMAAKAAEAAEEYRRARDARLKAEGEDFARQNVPITRKGLVARVEG